jgi:formylglycine-generating enzyme required for sulfatase activity
MTHEPDSTSSNARSAAQPVPPYNRLALVIGINRYPKLTNEQQLKKAVSDAGGIKVALESLGFEVYDGIDLDRSSLVHQINDFESRIGRGDTVFFFFAGHGVAINGENFLLPADVPPPKEGQQSLLCDLAYSVTTLVDRFKTKAGLLVTVLDACRNNPFERSGTRSLKLGRGLAPMQVVPTGTFILYSAAAGQEALDRLDEEDPDENSVFTRVFLKRVKQRNLPLTNLVQRVRKEVRDLASKVGHEQHPAYYDEVIDSDTVFLAGSDAIYPAEILREARTGWFQDLDLAPKMVEIPEGTILCGAGPRDSDALPHEKPQHEVRIAKRFALGRSPVTVAQWRAYAREKGLGNPQGADPYPVVEVSWDDADAYVRWLSQKTGHRYRLPSEAEWEYAARAGRSGWLYSWGDSQPTRELAHYGRRKGGAAAQIEQLDPNNFGLFDMHGNVAEWVADSYHNYTEYSALRSDGSPVVLDPREECRGIVRGGSWHSPASDLRCASRRIHAKTESTRDIGFRVARDL